MPGVLDDIKSMGEAGISWRQGSGATQAPHKTQKRYRRLGSPIDACGIKNVHSIKIINKSILGFQTMQEIRNSIKS